TLQVINQRRLSEINAIGDSEAEEQEFIDELKDLFLAHAPETYQEVLRLIENGERENLRSQAHRLKGLAYNLAAEKLCAVCAKIETDAAQSRMDDARKMKSSLVSEWQTLISFLQKDLH